jgi:hypothetical protein
MKYNFSILNNSLIIANEQNVILSNLTVRINYVRSKNIGYFPSAIETDNNKTTVYFERTKDRSWRAEAEYVKLIFKEENGALLAIADFACANDVSPYNYTYTAFESAFIDFSIPENKSGMLNLHSTIPFWLTPSFVMDTKDYESFLEMEVGSLSYKIKNDHVHILPLVNDDIRTHLEPKGLVIDTCVVNKDVINSGAFLISSADTPLNAISQNFIAGKDLNAIKVDLLKEREYPEVLNGFGWCTWNAFYHDVTSEKIYQKLNEFKEKGVKIKWLLVDDGWQQYADHKLLSIKEDPEKFPEGFKAFTKKVKEEYGVKYIGVWHAFEGYWSGIHKDGELYQNNKDLFFETPTGWVVPGETEEKAFEFWNMQHGYLKEQGIDFVKVDNQAAASAKYDNILSGSSAANILHTAIEKSVFKHFGGAVINCMGCKMENILSRPHSALNRNSDDFYPNKKHGFIKHLVQNVYVSPVHNQIHHCDFDMFWTKHETATVNAVLRAVSGGPIYVSDEVGNTDAQVLKPLTTENADIWRFENAAMVTNDLFYTDCSQKETPLKVWNKSGDNFVVAAFGITIDKTVKGVLKLSDIPNANGKYLVHDFFGDKYFVLDNDGKIDLEISYNNCSLYSLYKISKNDTVSLGDKTYYAEAADPNPKTVSTNDIIEQ